MHSVTDLPPELQLMVSESLDTETLLNSSLVSRSWRALILPVLLRHVDLSAHNEEHPPRRGANPNYYFSWVDEEHEPRHPRRRQLAFLRLILNRPELARLVESLAWTLMWRDGFDDGWEHTDLELRTWEAFSLMRNVRKLDLAAFHRNGELVPARQNPDSLFPAVRDLCLGGWLHRGLVRAIVNSIDVSKLVALDLHHLQDEGAWHSGEPLPWDIINRLRLPRGDPYHEEGISDDVWARQERGAAAYLPGPMWYLLRLLRQSNLSSMRHFTVDLCPPSCGVFERNDITMFRELAEFIQSAKNTLETVSISLGEDPEVYPVPTLRPGAHLGRAWQKWRAKHMLSFHLASAFLKRVLPVLTDNKFPRLNSVDMKGFRVLKPEEPKGSVAAAALLTTWDYINRCPFVNSSIVDAEHVDYYTTFDGYDCLFHELKGEELYEAEWILFASLRSLIL